MAQAKASVKGAKLIKKQNKSAGNYAALTVRGKHVAYLTGGKLGANVTLSVNGKRVTHKLKSESDISAAVNPAW